MVNWEERLVDGIQQPASNGGFDRILALAEHSSVVLVSYVAILTLVIKKKGRDDVQ